MVGQKFKLMSFSSGVKEETGRAWNRVEVRCYDVESCYATSITEFIDSKLAQKLENKGLTKPGFDGIDVNELFNTGELVVRVPVGDYICTVAYDNIFKELLTSKKVRYNNEIIEEEKGIMAGVPISSFLANYYLKDLDKYFYDNKIIYSRYADDIIIFTKTKEEIEIYKGKINDF